MNKSEELAKLLGIKPKAYCSQLQDNEYCSKFQGYTEECKQNCIAIYPDFTEPSNFVKIMTLAHKADCFVCCGTEYRDGDIMQDCFLDLIIQDISDESYKQDWAKEYIKIRNKFIKQAQQAEWEY